VFDGHGPAGNKVSDFISRTLPQKMQECFSIYQTLSPQHVESDSSEDGGSRRRRRVTWNDLKENEVKQICTQAFSEVAKQLKSSKIETEYSGSTCCLMLVLDRTIITANLGDSRAINFTLSESSYLTHDHKPSNAGEYERITSKGGKVKAFEDASGR